MPILVEKNAFQKLFNAFLGAKSQDKEKQFISKIKHSNPQLGNAFSKIDDILINRSLSLKKDMEDLGLDTSDIDNWFKKYYNTK